MDYHEAKKVQVSGCCLGGLDLIDAGFWIHAYIAEKVCWNIRLSHPILTLCYRRDETATSNMTHVIVLDSQSLKGNRG